MGLKNNGTEIWRWGWWLTPYLRTVPTFYNSCTGLYQTPAPGGAPMASTMPASTQG